MRYCAFLVLLVACLFVTLGCDGSIEVKGTVWQTSQPDLQSGVYIEGEVLEASSENLAPVEGALIRLFLPKGMWGAGEESWAEATTDKYGRFDLYQVVPAGRYKYRISVMKKGYPVLERQLEYMSERHVSVICIMKKE